MRGAADELGDALDIVRKQELGTSVEGMLTSARAKRSICLYVIRRPRGVLSALNY